MENNTEKNEIPGLKLNIPSAIVFAGVIIAFAIFINHGSVASAPNDKEDDSTLVDAVTPEDFVRGDKDAQITLIEYADFSCHFCAVFHPDLIKLLKEYDGQIRWVYRHLPIFNIDAAVASSCVGDIAGNDAFWKFSDILFGNQDRLKPDFYLSTAVSLGVSESQFNACIIDPANKNKIRAEFTKSKILLGLNATPHTILIDKTGKKFSFDGALPYEELATVIDSLIK